MKMAKTREKWAQESRDITETPVRNLLGSHHTKRKESQQERTGPTQKIKEHEEEGAAEVFWGGAMHAGTNHGRHTNRGSNEMEGQEIRRGHQLKEERVSQVEQFRPTEENKIRQ